MILRISFLLLLLTLGTRAIADSFWVASCSPKAFPCHVSGGAIVIWRDGQGQLQGLVRHPDAAGVFVRNGNLRWLLGAGGQFSLTESHQYLFTRPGSEIEVEFSDTKILKHPASSLSNAIISLPTSLTDEVPAPSAHLSSEADQRSAAPSYLVPSTKPQAEFAIRSQGGQSIFTETGR